MTYRDPTTSTHDTAFVGQEDDGTCLPTCAYCMILLSKWQNLKKKKKKQSQLTRVSRVGAG